MTRIEDTPYVISWVDDLFGTDPDDDNIDVTVTFKTGARYVATFFTIENLRSLLERYRETGECAGGLYVWSTHMLVVTRLTKSNIERAVADLVATGEFEDAFEGPFSD